VLKASAAPLDQVILINAAGAVVSAAPAGSAAAGKALLSPADLKPRYRPAPYFALAPAAGVGQGRVVWVSVPLIHVAGARRTMSGFLVEAVSLDGVLRSAAGGSSDLDVKVFVADGATGAIVAAPTPDLLGKIWTGTSEFSPLALAREGEAVELRYNLGRAMGSARAWTGAQLAFRVIGVAMISPAAGSGQGGESSVERREPVLILAVIFLAGAVLTALLLVMPFGRMGGLVKAAESIAAGAASVEFKGANAKDEIGAVARALESVGEQLAGERRHREETAQAYAALQRDLQRVNDEHKELTEYQRNQEANARREKQALEGELGTARSELDGARKEVESLRGEVAARSQDVAIRAQEVASRDQSIQERDRALAARDEMLVAANESSRLATDDLANVRQQVVTLTAQLAELKHDLEHRPAGPVAAFSLFSEASEALSVELSGLLELVQGYVQQIISSAEGNITEEQQQFLTTVINRSARSQRLMGDLKDFSTIAKPDGLAKEPLDLTALLNDVVATVQQSAEDKGVEFTADIPPALPEAIGDEARLRQMFTVLLQNAIRFTPEGSQVTMSVILRETMAGIRIEDGAEPIPVKSEDVFDHFHPADEEVLELRGSGLRFPMLRAIAGSHGGSIDMAINDRGGNLFFVRLPVRAGAPEASDITSLFSAVTSGEAAAAPEPFDLSAAEPEPAPAAQGPALDPAFAQFDAVFGQESAPAAPPATPAAPAAIPPPSGGSPGLALDPAFAQFDAVFGNDAPSAPAPAPAPQAAPAATPPEVLAADPAFAQFDAVFGGGASAAPATPTLDALEAAPDMADPNTAMPDLWPVAGDAGPLSIDAIEAAPDAAPAVPGAEPPAPPPPPFAFGSDEIIQE
jgi:signal transduction histidine kinase